MNSTSTYNFDVPPVPFWAWTPAGPVWWNEDTEAQAFMEGPSARLWDCDKKQLISGYNGDSAWIVQTWSNDAIPNSMFTSYPSAKQCPPAKKDLETAGEKRLQSLFSELTAKAPV